MNISFYKLGFIILALWNSFPLVAQESWIPIYEVFLDELEVRLQIKANAYPTNEEWIALELVNHGTAPIPVKNAFGKFEWMIAPRGSKAQKASRKKPSLQHCTIPLLSNTLISPGQHFISKNISAEASLSLGDHSNKPKEIQAWFSLNLAFAQKDKKELKWSKIDFKFHWHPPSKAQTTEAWNRLEKYLLNPASGSLTASAFAVLLAHPQLQKKLDFPLLYQSLQLHQGLYQGRIALVKYLNDHFPQEEKLIQYFRKQLFRKNYQALVDLTEAPAIWSDEFLEPLITWFMEGNSGAMYRIMEMMYVHQDNWINKPGISSIFYDLTVYHYQELIYKTHTELSDRELLVWSSAAELIAKTGFPEARDLLLPYLKCKKSLVKEGLSSASPNHQIPPPLRIADIALEGLLRLERKDLEQVYLEEGYLPPYEKEEAEMIITNIREELMNRKLR